MARPETSRGEGIVNDESVTVQRPDPPREIVFEKSGGLNVAFGCGNGKHVWIHARNQQPRGRCACGERQYQKTLSEMEYASRDPAVTAMSYTAPPSPGFGETENQLGN